MFVEQAVFTSARTMQHQGYQIVGRSSGVDDGLCRFLARWGPTHGSLICQDPIGDSVNYSAADQDWVALSRTLYGGPEYSGRGTLQVVTRFLVLRRSQLAGYDYNPALVARTALTLGHLWLAESPPTLPQVELPEQAPEAAFNHAVDSDAAQGQLARSHQVLQSNRLALIGIRDPLTTIAQLFDLSARAHRLELSFTTGLWPSQHRRFRVHVLPQLDAALHARLSQQGIRFVAATV